ncbi:MAG: Zn-ribbon containing protein [Candidatus Aenigmarchaeota archaeon]|nr:Zn-ribbon containing protein [Candidatus Aenigmarchaeota archaeon]
MPNRCTRCGKLHPDEAPYLLKAGCDCGSRFFFFVKEESLVQAEKEIDSLTPEDVKHIESDIRFIVSETEREVDDDETVVLDVEAIRIIKPGKYHIDLTNLFSQKPIVIRIGSGKYKIDLSSLMKARMPVA